MSASAIQTDHAYLYIITILNALSSKTNFYFYFTYFLIFLESHLHDFDGFEELDVTSSSTPV